MATSLNSPFRLSITRLASSGLNTTGSLETPDKALDPEHIGFFGFVSETAKSDKISEPIQKACGLRRNRAADVHILAP
jgi:hypothetical protein